jgi:hypothetical protein
MALYETRSASRSRGDELSRGFRLVPRERLADKIAHALDREALARRDLVDCHPGV